MLVDWGREGGEGGEGMLLLCLGGGSDWGGVCDIGVVVVVGGGFHVVYPIDADDIFDP